DEDAPRPSGRGAAQRRRHAVGAGVRRRHGDRSGGARRRRARRDEPGPAVAARTAADVQRARPGLRGGRRADGEVPMSKRRAEEPTAHPDWASDDDKSLRRKQRSLRRESVRTLADLTKGTRFLGYGPNGPEAGVVWLR